MVGPFSIWGMSLIKELETKIKGGLETILQIVQAVVIDIYIFYSWRSVAEDTTHFGQRTQRNKVGSEQEGSFLQTTFHSADWEGHQLSSPPVNYNTSHSGEMCPRVQRWHEC